MIMHVMIGMLFLETIIYGLVRERVKLSPFSSKTICILDLALNYLDKL